MRSQGRYERYFMLFLLLVTCCEVERGLGRAGRQGELHSVDLFLDLEATRPTASVELCFRAALFVSIDQGRSRKRRMAPSAPVFGADDAALVWNLGLLSTSLRETAEPAGEASSERAAGIHDSQLLLARA
jgi:hypothetical protein